MNRRKLEKWWRRRKKNWKTFWLVSFSVERETRISVPRMSRKTRMLTPKVGKTKIGAPGLLAHATIPLTAAAQSARANLEDFFNMGLSRPLYQIIFHLSWYNQQGSQLFNDMIGNMKAGKSMRSFYKIILLEKPRRPARIESELEFEPGLLRQKTVTQPLAPPPPLPLVQRKLKSVNETRKNCGLCENLHQL